jgi:hypothetical protein
LSQMPSPPRSASHFRASFWTWSRLQERQRVQHERIGRALIGKAEIRLAVRHRQDVGANRGRRLGTPGLSGDGDAAHVDEFFNERMVMAGLTQFLRYLFEGVLAVERLKTPPS